MHLKTDTRSSNAHFAAVPTISYSRNAFGIAEKLCTTMKFDYLYPMYTKFLYPGDTISINQQSLARLTTQIVPLFDDLYIDAHAWLVPLRLLQTNFARFQFNAKVTGPTQDNTALTTPNIDLTTLGAGGFVAKSLYDYLGYPTAIDLSGAPGNTLHINNYLARAYNLIYNTNYLDQNLQTPSVVDLDDGPDVVTDYPLLKRGKRHDKFTSCLTAQQKGTAVTLPLGTSAPVLGIGMSTAGGFIAGPVNVWETGTSGVGTFPDYKAIGAVSQPAGELLVIEKDTVFTDNPNIRADLTNAVAATINQVRSAYAVQHLLEADARGGTRDVESIKHRWGVTVPDFRLQRPEFLGSTTWAFDGHIVPSSVETATVPQGTLTQFSQTMNSFSISHSSVEHAILMILFSARSNITYQQGLSRELAYRTRYDFYQPEFANLGEVAVLNKEIMLQGTSADTATFGYQEYAYELRYSENKVTAEMRSNYATSLDSQHMADDYAVLPTLGSAWILSNTNIDRNIAVAQATADSIQFNLFVQGKIARTLPMYSVPGLTRL